MSWLSTIIETIKRLFSLGEKIADNRGDKIPYQKEAIQAKADTKVLKNKLKQDKLEAEREWRRHEKRFDFLAENNLTRREEKKHRKQLEKLVKSGAIVTDISESGDGLIVSYTYKERGYQYQIEF